jgi:D-alanyl-lipoteichoic acid acyltransferase DltB (MBOAT superfamily)
MDNRRISTSQKLKPWLKKEYCRKLFLILSVAVNLCILGVFKYFNFFASNLTSLLQSVFDITPNALTLNIILPVGISFYTFKTISYSVDVYRGNINARSLSEVAAYIAFFPQLLAGPIERSKNFLTQFEQRREMTPDKFREGTWLIFWGLYKKMVIADRMAMLVNGVFAPFDKITSGNTVAVPEDGLRLLIAVYAFAIQIYCDFSGYSDMAIGTAKLLGFDTMLNFNLPYFSRTPSEFWRRWHISLSTWLRDYLYIPLGGNRGGNIALYRNLMITMLLGGLWHGAAWTFVLWGAFHGIILVIYRALGISSEKPAPKWLAVAQGLIMFHLICLGWLLFRAHNLETVRIFLKSIIFNPHMSAAAFESLKDLIYYSWFLIAFQVIQRFTAKLDPMSLWPWFLRLNIWVFILMSLMRLCVKGGQEFIYFAF